MRENYSKMCDYNNFLNCEPRRGEARNLVRYGDKHFFDTVYVCSTFSLKLNEISN